MKDLSASDLAFWLGCAQSTIAKAEDIRGGARDRE
jgi:hypothetical protein